MIHVYLALDAWMQILRTQWAHLCCCCQSTSKCLRLKGNNGPAAAREAGAVDTQPILKFYDETTARPSSEFMTSGCNTPRMSQETLESERRGDWNLV
jgi:hypothetical protein